MRRCATPLRQLDSSIAYAVMRDAETCQTVLREYRVDDDQGGPDESPGDLALPSPSIMAAPSPGTMAVPSPGGANGAAAPYVIQCDRADTRQQLIRDEGDESALHLEYEIAQLWVDVDTDLESQMRQAQEVQVAAAALYEILLDAESNDSPYGFDNFGVIFAPRAIPLTDEARAAAESQFTTWLQDLVGLRYEQDGVVFERITATTLVRTILFALFATTLSLIACYPIAYNLALRATPQRAMWLFVALIIPYATVELMRVYAWVALIDANGVFNQILHWLGIIDLNSGEGIAFKRSPITVFVVIVYTYILFMVFPLYNVMATLDKNQIEAARDLGSSTTRIHRRIIIPHAKPGVAVGCIATFMLSAGAFSVPRIISRGLQGEWFSQTIYNKFFESQEYQPGIRICVHLHRALLHHRCAFHVAGARPAEGLHPSMSTTTPRIGLSQRILSGYTMLFVLFMFLPLVLLMVASVNDVSPPSVTDWQGLTGKWYAFLWMDDASLRADPVLRALDQDRFYACFGNSMIVGAFVVPLSLILGLSGAILLTRWQSRFNGFLWWVLLSPMLAPGIVLGLSTLILWSEVGVSAGLPTIIVAQTDVHCRISDARHHGPSATPAAGTGGGRAGSRRVSVARFSADHPAPIFCRRWPAPLSSHS